MKVWYISYNRFEKRIVSKWKQRNFIYNQGHLNILRYAYQTATFWAMVNRSKISEVNKQKGYPKLF